MPDLDDTVIRDWVTQANRWLAYLATVQDELSEHLNAITAALPG
jgi:phosphatidate phosphatase APP1